MILCVCVCIWRSLKNTPSNEEKTAPTDTTKSGKSRRNNNETSGEFLALVDKILAVLWQVGVFIGFLFVCQKSYNIRLYAVEEYGAVIHEFDPYFNFRSTEYLVEHGWTKFINWSVLIILYPLRNLSSLFVLFLRFLHCSSFWMIY